MEDGLDGKREDRMVKLQFPLTRPFYYGDIRFYYAIGNTPANNLFLRSIDSGSSRFDVGCIGCGDLRHVLFSLSSIREEGVDVFRKDDKVVIDGLRSGIHLNGKEGIISSYVPAKQRYEVKLQEDGKEVSKLLKKVNLKLVKNNEAIDKNISFFINDFDTHVVARNLFLIECTRFGLSSETIFAIWFSIGLTTKQHQDCISILKKLVTKYEKLSLNSSLDKISFHSEEDRIQVLTVWRKWLNFSSKSHQKSLPCYADVQKMRQDTFLRHFNRNSGEKKDNNQKVEKLSDHFKNRMKLDFELEKYYFNEECKDILNDWCVEKIKHLDTGNFNVELKESEQNKQVNPTLFWKHDDFNLHYGTMAYDAFPMSVPTKGKPLIDLCFEEFQKWMDALRFHDVSWIFSCQDCKQLDIDCSSFDVVTTSNVTDHVGLLTLLTVCTPWLKEYGILQTTTFLYLTDSDDPLDFVKSQLKLADDWKWPGLLGLQLVGLSSDEDLPLSGKFQSNSNGLTKSNIIAFLNKEEKGSVRSDELELLWIKKPKPKICLSGDRPSIEVLGFINPSLSSGHISEKIRDLASMMYRIQQDFRHSNMHYHSGSLFPLFCRISFSQSNPEQFPDCWNQLLSECGRLNVETSTLHCLYDLFMIKPEQTGTVLCSVTLSKDRCDNWIAKQLIPMVKIGSTTYDGCWFGESHSEHFFSGGTNSNISDDTLSEHSQPEKKQLLFLYFFAQKDCIADQTADVVDARIKWTIQGSLEITQHDICKKEVLRLRKIYGFPEFQNPNKSENQKRRTTSIWITEDQKKHIIFEMDICKVFPFKSSSLSVERIAIQNPSNQVSQDVFQIRSNKGTIVYFSSGPYNLDISDYKFKVFHESVTVIRLLLTVKRKLSDNIVRHLTESSFIEISHFYNEQAMVTLSGSQFSDEEKFIVRSREPSQIPPLLNLKDSLMFFFQCHQETHFALADHDNSQCALIIHHGLKTHRTLKIPFADLSAVFLTFENMAEVLADPQSNRGSYQLNGNKRIIKVDKEEFKVFQEVVEIFRLKEMSSACRLEKLQLIVDGKKIGVRNVKNTKKLNTTEKQRIQSFLDDKEFHSSEFHEKLSIDSKLDDMISISNEHPELKTFFPSPSGRFHWKRVLLAPLYHPIHLVMQRAMKAFDKNGETSLKELNIEQKVSYLKLKGNEFFKKQDWGNATKNYQQGIIEYEQSPTKRNVDDKVKADVEKKAEKIKEVTNWGQLDLNIVASYSNLALCQLKTENFTEAVIAAERAVEHIEIYLENEECNDSKIPHTTTKWKDMKFKSLYRLAIALKELNLYDKAISTIQLAMTYAQSSDKLCEKELADIAKCARKGSS